MLYFSFWTELESCRSLCQQKWSLRERHLADKLFISLIQYGFLKKVQKKFVHTYYFIHMYTTTDVSKCMNAIAREEESYRDFGGPSTNANLYMHHSRPLLGLLTRKAHCKPDLFGEQRRRGRVYVCEEAEAAQPPSSSSSFSSSLDNTEPTEHRNSQRRIFCVL